MHWLKNMKQLSSVKDSLLWIQQAYKSNRIKQLNSVDKLS